MLEGRFPEVKISQTNYKEAFLFFFCYLLISWLVDCFFCLLHGGFFDLFAFFVCFFLPWHASTARSAGFMDIFVVSLWQMLPQPLLGYPRYYTPSLRLHSWTLEKYLLKYLRTFSYFSCVSLNCIQTNSILPQSSQIISSRPVYFYALPHISFFKYDV